LRTNSVGRSGRDIAVSGSSPAAIDVGDDQNE
jgi:hypothetical protein